MPKVVEVIFKSAEHFLHSIRIAVVQSGIAGDSRTNLIKVNVPVVIFHYLVNEEFPLRSWADESHVTTEYIIQLRKFVKMVSSDESAHLCKPLITIATAGAELRSKLFGVQSHGSEFVDVERTAKTTDSLLFEYCRTSILHFYGNVAYQKQWGENNQCD